MENNSQNCYFCKSKAGRIFSGWTLSKDDWKKMREKHEKEHGQFLKTENKRFANLNKFPAAN